MCDGDMKTQRAQREGSRLPAGLNLFADPEHLNHQEEPLEDHQSGDDQHHHLLRGLRSDADDGKDDGQTSSPYNAEKEHSNYGGHMSGRSHQILGGIQLTHVVTGNADVRRERGSVGNYKHSFGDN